ncbi:flavin-dependent oxidoreductase [Shimia sp.]|uniref:flavin-dependent oxidoreductase n=1 Tax=Shimia sp. TaxID=1954381 RepID=UPI003BA9E82E
MPTASDLPIVIAGGGIGGLVTALTLHQIGQPVVVLEAVETIRPLGVGINLQPNAVRELLELGFTLRDLDAIGLPITEWALVGLNGKDIYSEPRGEAASYHWPQYAVHRGRFHMMLRDAFLAKAGPDALITDHRVLGYSQSEEDVTAHWQTRSGFTGETKAALLIGADGIHSKVRAQMHPNDGGVQWGGVLMWRGTSLAKPLRTKASFIGLGTHDKRVVLYPISAADAQTGLAEINWIAEITLDGDADWPKDSWFSPVPPAQFLAHFADWKNDWLDVPALISATPTAFENPMIDRNPLPHWHQNRVALLGDAAHAMYPTGSNGATQAIIDARELGKSLCDLGVTPAALTDYNNKLCDPVAQLVLRNRADGPFGLLKHIDQLCGGQFDDIDAVISPKERADFMRTYQTAAGFERDALNASKPILSRSASLRSP